MLHYFDELFGMQKGAIFALIVGVGIKLLMAITIFIVGFWLSKFLVKTVKRLMNKANLDAGLISFMGSMINIILKILVIITAITQVGVQMTSFVAILGAAGLAIGLAFSGTLSNFAGGVMILFFKPFKVGDFIDSQSVQGTVSEIQIFNTYLTTPDNKIIILPNGPVANGNIINFTKAQTRRVDWKIGIAYGDDMKKAREVLTKFIEEDPKILKDPAPFIGLGELANSSVSITVRAWTSVEDYWEVFFAMNERVYNEFGDNGLNFPFPQMDVHFDKEYLENRKSKNKPEDK